MKGAGTPAQGLAEELDFVDQSLGSIVRELKKEGLYESTLIMVSAKHGQSPIDITKRRGIGGGQPAATVGAAEAFDISDDGSLIWLTDPSLVGGAVANLSKPRISSGIQEIFAGTSLRNKWNSPGDDRARPTSCSRSIRGSSSRGARRLPSTVA